MNDRKRTDKWMIVEKTMISKEKVLTEKLPKADEKINKALKPLVGRFRWMDN